MPRPPKSDLTTKGTWKPEIIERALTELAVHGSSKQAAAAVKAAYGSSPTDSTIIQWAKDTHNEQYLRIREDVAEQIKVRVATDVEDLLRETLEVQREALARTRVEIPNLDTRDTPGALRNVATSAAILADKLQQMRGGQQITVSHELNADELLSKLSRLLPGAGVVDSTAEEVPELAQGSGQAESSEAVSGA